MEAEGGGHTCTRITSSLCESIPIILLAGSCLKRTRSSHTRSSIPFPAVKRKGTPRHRSESIDKTSAAKVGQREPAGTVLSSR